MLECLCGCLEGLWWFAIGAGIGAYRSEQLQPCMHRTGKKGAKELKRRASVKLGVISQADAEILWKAEKEEAEAKAKEEAEARARQDADAKARAEAEARAKEDTAAIVREEARAKPREEAADGPDLQDVPMGTFVAPPDDMPLYTFAGSPDEQNMPTGTFDMPTGTFVAPDDVPEAKAEAEARAMEEAAAKAKAEAEAEAREEAAAKAKAEAEAKAREEAAAKAKAEAEAKAREEAAAKAKAEAEAKAREEAEAKAKAEAEAKAREEAEAKAKAEAEAKAREEAEAKAKAEAEAEEKAKEVAAAKAKELADAVAQEEAEAKGAAYRSVVRDALSKATDAEVASLSREEKLLQLAHECAALLPDKPPEDSEEASALEEQMSPLARRFGEEIFQEVVDAAEIAIAASKGESEGKGVPEALRGTEELAELARKMVACTDPAEGEALAAPDPALEEFFIGTFQVAEGPGRSSAAHEDGAGAPPTSTIADTSTEQFFIGTFPVGEGLARTVAYEETARPAMQEGTAKATIVGTSKENDTTFYRIELYEVGASRTFLKRFNDFKTFDKALRDSSPALRKALPELPAAGLFGVRHRLGLSDFERKRQDGLQRYLDAAASQLDGSTFRAFFEGQSTSVSTPTP